MKKIYSILLVLAMLFGLTSVDTYALDTNFKEIENIKLSIDFPKIGNGASAPTILELDEADESTAYATISGYQWYKISSDIYTGTDSDQWTELAAEEAFTGGYVYYLEIDLMSKDERPFAEELRVNVNDLGDICFDTDRQTTVTISFTFENLASIVSNIKATVTEPKLGEKPSFDVTVVTTPSIFNNYQVIDSSKEYVVRWWKIVEDNYPAQTASDWLAMGEDDVFQEGYYYLFEVYFFINAGYVIDKNATGSVNGKEHFDIYNQVCYEENSIGYLCALYEPLKAEEAKTDDVPKTEETTEKENVIPATGDNNLIYLALASMALSGITITYVEKKRKK